MKGVVLRQMVILGVGVCGVEPGLRMVGIGSEEGKSVL
jgi:hypothetical protein